MVALGYPVTVEAGSLDRIAEVVARAGDALRPVVISDSRVAPLYGARVLEKLRLDASALIVVPEGEEHKNRDTWARVTDEMIVRGYGRDTIVIAVGGGVIGDLAGFVAATYMRGVPLLQVPTSLLAMVDASIGGKTGVDTPGGKNLVGAFHQPVAVLIDPAVLRTLPERHLRAGCAEILKHGVIADARYFDDAAACFTRGVSGAGDTATLSRLIARSVEIKSGIVARDERESGLRKVLNFGHTIGHAIEAATNYATLHGDAVAVGLVVEARVAERLGVAQRGVAGNIERVVHECGLPTGLPNISADALIRFTRTDKKSRAGRVEYSLPKRIGEMAGADRGWTFPVDDAIVRESLTS